MRYDEYLINISNDSHPKEIMVEISRRCNYQCIFCFRDGLPKSYLTDMDSKTFETLVDQAMEAKVEKFAFTGWGEPLIHPRSLEYMEMAKELGFKVLLNTNGSYLYEYADDLVKNQVDEVVVSIDAGEEKPYSMIRVGGELNLIEKGLGRLKALKKGKNTILPIIKFQFTLNKINIDSIMNIATLAKKYKVKDVIISNVIPTSPENERRLSCIGDGGCLEKLEKVKNELVKHTLQTNIYFHLSNTSLKTERRCPFMEADAVYVTVEGDIAPCIYYAHSWKPSLNGLVRDIKQVRFGNIFRNNLINIWHNQRYVRFRFTTKFFLMPSCLDCELEKTCLISRSNEYDCWGNSPTCSQCPYSRDLARCPL